MTLPYLGWAFLKSSDMAKNNYFQFKEFRIVQEKAAMRVNTDGVLLGGWANVAQVQTILDVGTGTGLIALMLAQRSKAKIIGVEIEKNAAEEANFNIQNSKWNSRISIENIAFQKFANSHSGNFDLIVSNPPFFSNSEKNPDPKKSIARHNDSLPFTELLKGTAKSLNENGRLAVILPRNAVDDFQQKANDLNLFLNRICEVFPKNEVPANRALLEFSKQKTPLETSSLTIYNSENHSYTDEMVAIAKDFYLHL